MSLGVQCETRCPAGKYGEDCMKDCNCKNNSSCDAITGNCICSRGWQGDDCSKPCDNGYFGYDCKEVCPKNPTETTTCDHITGKLICQPGFYGPTCMYPCAIGTYGKNCAEKCDCIHGGVCHYVTGKKYVQNNIFNDANNIYK